MQLDNALRGGRRAELEGMHWEGYAVEVGLWEDFWLTECGWLWWTAAAVFAIVERGL